VLVRATKSGKAVFEAVTPKIQALHRRQWSNLTRQETVELDRLLLKAMWGDNPPPI
jgi:DNA-binding MarR family transcriptional regulator